MASTTAIISTTTKTPLVHITTVNILMMMKMRPGCDDDANAQLSNAVGMEKPNRRKLSAQIVGARF